jgi:hypothetical protein
MITFRHSFTKYGRTYLCPDWREYSFLKVTKFIERFDCRDYLTLLVQCKVRSFGCLYCHTDNAVRTNELIICRSPHNNFQSIPQQMIDMSQLSQTFTHILNDTVLLRGIRVYVDFSVRFVRAGQ